MATDPAATRKLWEDAFREKRELITTLDPAKLDRPTANVGWTVRNLAAHVAMGSDSPMGMAAPKLSGGSPSPASSWSRPQSKTRTARRRASGACAARSRSRF